MSSKADINEFMHNLKMEDNSGSLTKARQTVKFLREIIASSKWNTAQEIIEIVRSKGAALQDALAVQTAVGNMVRRILKIIRDEYARAASQGQMVETETKDSLHRMLTTDNEPEDYSMPLPSLKNCIMEAIAELLMDLETSQDNIAAQALEHIHANELILTIAKSRTVEAFLKKAAAAKRKFQVIVVECAPKYSGHELAKNLAHAGIETTVITDAQIFSIMSRVNKVIIGTHSVTADGGLMAVCGAHTVGLAAKYYSVPTYVCVGMHKLCPVHVDTQRQLLLNRVPSPENILSFSEASDLIAAGVEIIQPEFDYVASNLVTLFITNNGGNDTSYMYRLLSEYYHPTDHKLNPTDHKFNHTDHKLSHTDNKLNP